MKDRLIIALDASSRDDILRLVDQLSGLAGMFKIGLQAFVKNGPSIMSDLVGRGEKVFLDLKFHDIPNTAMHAVAEAAALGASIVNIHAAGGGEMMRACASAIAKRGNPLVVAVTVLTSLSDPALEEIGLTRGSEEQVVRLALLAQRSGLDGVVASPLEIRRIREECGKDFVILTPGIRAESDVANDQKRTMSAREALRAGANFIVVGRPITAAADPRAAAQRILDEAE